MEMPTITPARKHLRLSLLNRLILFFLIALVIPLVGVSLLTLTQLQGALRDQMSNKLIAVRDLKARQIEGYFQSVAEDIILASQLPTILNAVQEFGSTEDLYSIRRLGYLGNPDLVHSGKGSPYDVVHARYFGTFSKIVTAKGYYDIYLVTPGGDLVYNYDKGDDFATNLLSGPYRDTVVADLFRQLQTSTNTYEVKITDFTLYGPSGDVAASFIGTPIVENRQNIGVLIYQLPVDRINTLLQDRVGMGETGETYLVGEDKLMRSDSRFTEESTILAEEVDTLVVQEALDGKAGVKEIKGYRGVSVLSAYQPIDVGGPTWTLLAEVEAAEFFTVPNRLRNLLMGIIGIAALTATGVGLAVSRQIVDPIRQLTASAQRIGAGDLGAEIVELRSQDEVGVLARAFRQMQGELKALYEGLEQQVAERTAELAIAKERAEAADRLKSAFLAAMSHELRTPLNSIIGFTGIVLQGLAGPLNDEQAKQLGMAYASARHLFDLIKDVLDISEIEAGQIRITRQSFDMCEAIEKVVRTMTPLAEKKGLALVAEVSPQVGQITSDQRRVEQILINLLNNAIKFTEDGEVRVECEVNDSGLVTRVVDTGIGIKPEDMGVLFEAFRQVDTGLARQHEGTGLGLSICKKLVEMLGGEIWVESEWGVGSTFTFTLPVKMGGGDETKGTRHRG